MTKALHSRLHFVFDHTTLDDIARLGRKEKFDTPRFFQRVKISTLRSVWSCKKGQSCSHMCVIWKCLG